MTEQDLNHTAPPADVEVVSGFEIGLAVLTCLAGLALIVIAIDSVTGFLGFASSGQP
jgi:hypothetical protein